MLRVILILLVVFSMAGCGGLGPAERPEDLRERSMEWPNMRPTEPLATESQARPTFDQR